MSTPPRAAISPELAAAQEQLEQLRCQRRQERLSQGMPLHTDERGRRLAPVQPASPNPRSPTDANPHVGWESVPLTKALRDAARRKRRKESQAEATNGGWLPSPPLARPSSRPPSKPTASATIALYPDLALAMLRQDLAAAGRIWLLLRHLDEPGQGWVSLQTARAQLTGTNAPLRVCGRRQLRNLLAQGESIFWDLERIGRGAGRIWLRSTARVSSLLNIRRLKTRAVALPVSILCAGMGQVRAHFYASFHSGRARHSPITRAALSRLSRVSRRSQQLYEKRSGVQRQRNLVIGPRYDQERAQQRGWRHGMALFKFTDYRGQQGAPGVSYLAWQLPNSYVGPHATLSKKRQKQINCQLVDLFTKGITGNGEQGVEREALSGLPAEAAPVRCFFEHGEAAARDHGKTPRRDSYWKSPKRWGNRAIWHLIPGTEAV